VSEAVWESGGVPREFNTIAVDDGIAMGHDGMLYSLPSRELIADSIEYMVNAHCADAIVCISNCDKITPGMLIAAMRLNIPAIFVSGGPMEAGRVDIDGATQRLDLSDAFVSVSDGNHRGASREDIESNACPTCGSCSGMFTANSMNCLAEALGLALPGNGSLLATHVARKELFGRTGRRIVEITKAFYEGGDQKVLLRALGSRASFMNAMAMDIAMRGSTNTILHLLAIAHEADANFSIRDIDQLSRNVPYLCKVAPSTSDYFMEDVHKAGGVMGILGELDRLGLLDTNVPHLASAEGGLRKVLRKWDVKTTDDPFVQNIYRSDASGITGAHAHSEEGGLAVLFGNTAENGRIVVIN